jgi:hypothetical protein
LQTIVPSICGISDLVPGFLLGYRVTPRRWNNPTRILLLRTGASWLRVIRVISEFRILLPISEMISAALLQSPRDAAGVTGRLRFRNFFPERMICPRRRVNPTRVVIHHLRVYAGIRGRSLRRASCSTPFRFPDSSPISDL